MLLHKYIVYTDTQNTASNSCQPKGSVLSIQTWKLLFHNTIYSVFILPDSLYAPCQMHYIFSKSQSRKHRNKKVHTRTG